MKTLELQTEEQIFLIKEIFSKKLREKLRLHQVFAPLFVRTATGLNDDLNGIERAISFKLKHTDEDYTIVHSLAKWKRQRLTELNIPSGEGIITNMTAIRADENLSHIHSALVDQWDWELCVKKKQRTLDYLKQTVEKIYTCIYETEQEVSLSLRILSPQLPPEIHFIHSEELLEYFPHLSPKEREDAICKKLGAVFIIGIGADLANGEPHDGRAPDYDDWSTPTSQKHKGLNGDILVWSENLGHALELSSMGIRVDAEVLIAQSEKRGVAHKLALPFQQSILDERLTYSLGGGIGQSRLAMFILQKQHIEQVQFINY